MPNKQCVCVFLLSSGGLVKIKHKLTTLPRSRAVCQFNLQYSRRQVGEGIFCGIEQRGWERGVVMKEKSWHANIPSILTSLVKSSGISFEYNWLRLTNHATKTHTPGNKEGGKKCWGNLCLYCSNRQTQMFIRIFIRISKYKNPQTTE